MGRNHQFFFRTRWDAATTHLHECGEDIRKFLEHHRTRPHHHRTVTTGSWWLVNGRWWVERATKNHISTVRGKSCCEISVRVFFSFRLNLLYDLIATHRVHTYSILWSLNDFRFLQKKNLRVKTLRAKLTRTGVIKLKKKKNEQNDSMVCSIFMLDRAQVEWVIGSCSCSFY